MASYATVTVLNLKPFKSILKAQGNGPLYRNTVIDTLTVDGWAVIRYSEDGPGRATAPPRPILAVPNVTAHPSTECTNFILFDMAL